MRNLLRRARLRFMQRVTRQLLLELDQLERETNVAP
ncbi:Uncharacterised protein [Bordetella ansorpii]|jgi:hypothetical protein|uniref:Uncharacterized protein n=1 Tax=Bordetella ansorpii TaxID=288768 RepID=A0A157S5D0_9BORD|nr:Uncharacterised protein [Bordetella ansorpii]SAI65589.1 Uncharacterised protein [Bordetella ansorpii]